MKKKNVTYNASALAKHGTLDLSNLYGWQRERCDGIDQVFSPMGQEPKPLVLPLPLRGWCEITVETWNPAPKGRGGVSGTLALELPSTGRRYVLPFGSGVKKHYLGTVKLNGGSIHITKVNSGPVGIKRIGFKTVEPAVRVPKASSHKLMLWGITDQFVQAHRIGSTCIENLEVNLREHAELGFTDLSWHAYGGQCYYPTRRGTRIPPMDMGDPELLAMLPRLPRALHFDFFKQELANRYDGLREAAALCRRHGLAFAPCMRMNNEWLADWAESSVGPIEYRSKYWGSAFLNDHPEYSNVYKDGSPSGAGLDYSYPAVRRYRMGIMKEVMERYPEIDSLFLDIHRQPRMVTYPQFLVDQYRAKTGIDVKKVKPITEETMDEGWLRFRAEHFTKFMRSVKKAKAAQGHAYPTVARVGSNFTECLLEGVDLQVWLKEGLVDVLMLEEHHNPSYACDYRPIIDAARSAGVRVLGAFPSVNFFITSPWAKVERELSRLLDQGVTGFALYESELAVMAESFRRRFPAWLAKQAV
ncbi:MAG: glycoside hydrolase family 10 protein [Planctomycetota bacterium]